LFCCNPLGGPILSGEPHTLQCEGGHRLSDVSDFATPHDYRLLRPHRADNSILAANVTAGNRPKR
jgi:hypothetical protein